MVTLTYNKLFAILQMYEFSSKSQPLIVSCVNAISCLRYCKCTSFQANHNKVSPECVIPWLFAILQMYEFSSKSQLQVFYPTLILVVCDTANVRVFKQITTIPRGCFDTPLLFAILQMYEFSSKSQPRLYSVLVGCSCLRYCKCTSFQANHNR